MAAIVNKPIPPGALDGIRKLSNWLQSPQAKYFVRGNITFCKNHEKLESVAPELLERFLEDMPVPSESFFTAIRFDGTTTIPVTAGCIVNLIPVHEVQGVTIEDHTIYSNHYVVLDRDTTVSGTFYGLLLVFLFDPVDEEPTPSRREQMKNLLKRALKMT
ncbi:hypothetical protein F5Y08DRAFT_344115 [Xylaria arbuscula]|nr:hypothetical protein F5Y08DRAFT_344115 [Xylaria arbuscula]